MPKFFKPEIEGKESIVLSDETAKHIAKSLRMKAGDEVVLCDGKGFEYGCIITQIKKDSVELKVCFKTEAQSEPDVKVEIYQGVPKGDKLAEVVRKCTELGVSAFHPVIMKRSVARPEGKSAVNKLLRLSKVACEAAEQSRRGIIPRIYDFEDYESAIKSISAERIILFYENGGEKLNTILKRYKAEKIKSIALVIGPEGGFEESEVELAKSCSAQVATLGKRILRTETAPVAAAANVFYELED